MMKIRVYPDPVLRVVSDPVEVIDKEFLDFAKELTDTMYAEDGVGLAAPQVGVNKRVIAVDVSPEREGATVLINPEITSRSGKEKDAEGCLSLPGLRGEVERAEKVVVEGQILDGSEVRIEAEGLAARAYQHEIDHLDGILFIDKLGKLERFRLRDDIRALEYEFSEKNGK